jgi:hypothetical protein
LPWLGFSYEPRKKIDILIPVILVLIPILTFLFSGQPISQSQQPTYAISFSFLNLLISSLSFAVFWLSITAYRLLGSRQVYYLSSAFLIFGLISLLQGIADPSLSQVTSSVMFNTIVFSILFFLAVRKKGRDEQKVRKRNIVYSALYSGFIVLGVVIGAATNTKQTNPANSTFSLAETAAIVSIPFLATSSFYLLRGFYRSPAAKVLLALGLDALFMVDRVTSFLFPTGTISWWVFGALFTLFLVSLVWSFTTLFPSEEIVPMKSLFAVVFGVQGTLAGVIILGSWVFGAGKFLALYGTTIPVAPITSVCAILTGIAALLFSKDKTKHSSYLSSVVLLLGLLGIIGVIKGFDPFAMFSSLFSTAFTPPRMAINTALSFIILSASIMVLKFKKSGRIFRNLVISLIIVPTVISISTLAGYALSIQPLYQWTDISVAMAPITAWLILFPSLSVLLGSRPVPDHEWRTPQMVEVVPATK